MQYLTIYVGTDFSDHSKGKHYCSYEIAAVTEENMLSEARGLVSQYAWVALISTEVGPDGASSNVRFNVFNPLKKKIVLDPRKNRTRSSVEKQATAPTLPQDFWNSPVVSMAVPASAPISATQWVTISVPEEEPQF